MADVTAIPGMRVGPLMKKKVEGPIRCGLKNLFEYKVMVLPDPVEEVTSGGIIKAPEARRLEELRTSKATLILRSENSFRDWGSYAPEPGARVSVYIFSGAIEHGPDGREYRIINDKDVMGELDEDSIDHLPEAVREWIEHHKA